MLEIDMRAYTSLPDKPLYLALLFSILIHGIFIVFGFLWLGNTLPASYKSPLMFEVSLLGVRESPVKDASREVVLPKQSQSSEVKTFPNEHEYKKISTPQLVPQKTLEQARDNPIKRIMPNLRLADLGESPTDESKSSSPQAIVTSSNILALPVELNLNEDQFELITHRLNLLRDQMGRFDRSEDSSEDGSEDSPAKWEIAGQKYTLNVERIPSKNNTLMDKARVEISTVIDGMEMSTTVQMKRLAFSSFVQIVNRWDPEVAFSQDVIEGRFHSNSRIHIAGGKRQEPTFKGKVSVSAGVSTHSIREKKRIFLGGIETRAKRIQFPKVMLNESPGDSSLILRLDKDSKITFLPNGDYHWFFLEDPQSIFMRPASKFARYIISGVGAKISVSGIVKGTVVIHAEDRITVIGNLLYAESPEDFPESTDYLGLISEKYVEVESPKITGRGDITIHAAIMAKRRFVIKNPRTRSHAQLTILGSLAAGSVSVSEPRFSTLLKYDRRFENKRLPGFPVTDKYELEFWDAKWSPKIPATF